MPVVEFFGLPGVGKSTICKSTVDLLRSKGHIVSVRDDLESWKADLTSKDRFSIRLLSLIHVILNLDIFLLFLLTLKPFEVSNITRFGSFFSRQIYLSRFVSNSNSEFIILEQGSAQEIWSLSISSFQSRLITRLVKRINSIDSFIYVYAPLEVVVRRIVTRAHGKSRFDVKEKEEAYFLLAGKEGIFDRFKAMLPGRFLMIESVDAVDAVSERIVNFIAKDSSPKGV